MLPLGILNASTMNVRSIRKSATEIQKILVHSHRKPRPRPRRRLTYCNASMRCDGVIRNAWSFSVGGEASCIQSEFTVAPRAFKAREGGQLQASSHQSQDVF